MALDALILLIGVALILMIVVATLYVVARHTMGGEVATPADHGATGAAVHDAAGMWSSLVGSLQEPVRPADSEETPTWKRHADAAGANNPGVYKTRPSSPFEGERWNPYAASQSTVNRAKAARRKPRPHRPSPPMEPYQERTNGANDAYDLLGVSRVASAEAVEQAYRRQVATFHPDKFHGDPVGKQHAHEKLKQLNAAVKVLRDARRRPAS